MHSKSLFILTLLLSSSFGSAQKDSPKIEKVINICAEDTGWLPYSSPVRDSATGEFDVLGFNRDVAEAVFSRVGVQFKFVVKPWQRCLKEAIDGDVDIVLDAASNEQRRRVYLLTTPIYTMTPAYFFHKSFEASLRDKTAKQIISSQPICGQTGYTYTNFGIPNEEVKKLSKALGRIIDLVSERRCKVGLTRLEVLRRELPNYKEYTDIAYSEIKGAKKENFYWLINKQSKFSELLKKTIDREYEALSKKGVITKIKSKYNL